MDNLDKFLREMVKRLDEQENGKEIPESQQIDMLHEHYNKMQCAREFTVGEYVTSTKEFACPRAGNPAIVLEVLEKPYRNYLITQGCTTVDTMYPYYGEYIEARIGILCDDGIIHTIWYPFYALQALDLDQVETPALNLLEDYCKMYQQSIPFDIGEFVCIVDDHKDNDDEPFPMMVLDKLEVGDRSLEERFGNTDVRYMYSTAYGGGAMVKCSYYNVSLGRVVTGWFENRTLKPYATN